MLATENVLFLAQYIAKVNRYEFYKVFEHTTFYNSSIADYAYSRFPFPSIRNESVKHGFEFAFGIGGLQNHIVLYLVSGSSVKLRINNSRGCLPTRHCQVTYLIVKLKRIQRKR